MKTIDGLNSTLDKILKGSDNRLHMCFHSFTSKNQNPAFTKLISFVIVILVGMHLVSTVNVHKTQFPKVLPLCGMGCQTGLRDP